jgi:hypothetical protein
MAIGTSTGIGTIAGATGATMAGDGTIAGGATTAGGRTAGAGVQGGGIGIMIGIVTVGIAGTGTEFLGPRVAALCICRRGCTSPMLEAAHSDLAPSTRSAAL